MDNLEGSVKMQKANGTNGSHIVYIMGLAIYEVDGEFDKGIQIYNSDPVLMGFDSLHAQRSFLDDTRQDYRAKSLVNQGLGR